MNNNIVVIIPARGGSKGIPKKNIALLKGKPLLAYTIESAIESMVAKEIFVSTDSEEIAKIAIKYGSKVIMRPAEISHDTASTESALIHAIETIRQEYNWMPDYVLTLPPTSPLRSAETIRKFVKYFLSLNDKYDAMLSLTVNRGDFWRKDSQGNFIRLFPDAPRRRQDREPLYLENSAIYITKTESLLTTNSILGKRCTGFILDDIEATDINEPIDLLWAEFLIENVINKKK